MRTAPLAFIKTDLPPHFAKGIEQLRASSSPDAKAQLDDVLGARAAIRVIVEGEGEAWIKVDQGALTAGDARPDGVPVRAAIHVDAAAAREALGVLESSGRMQEEKGPLRFARMFSARVEKMLDGQKLEFHVVIKDVPDHDGDVVIKVGIGTDTPPAKPQFSAALSYDDLEDLREGDLTPQQLIGRLRLTGDASRAMALGMMLMQPPKK